MKINRKQAWILFRAGMNCQKMHPDDSTYDKINLDSALKRANKLPQAPVKVSEKREGEV